MDTTKRKGNMSKMLAFISTRKIPMLGHIKERRDMSEKHLQDILETSSTSCHRRPTTDGARLNSIGLEATTPEAIDSHGVTIGHGATW